MPQASRRPPHPGAVLLRRFLLPLGISQSQFATHIHEYPPNLSMILRGKRRISPRHAWMLGQALGTSPEYWMNLQTAWDLWRARPKRPITRLRKQVLATSGTNGARKRR